MATAADQTIPAARLRPTRIEYFLVIPNPSGDRALLLPNGGEWTLPGWTHEGGEEVVQWHDVAPVDRALRERFGLNVSTLRCLQVDYVRTNPIYDQGYSQFAYETEPAPADWTPPAGGQWFGHDDLRNIRLSGREHLGVLGRWLDETDDPETAIERPDWYKPGWFAEATTWIESQLARLGLTPTAAPEQTRSRERSCELVIETTGGRVRFKALPEAFAHEVALMGWLSRTFPGQVPEMLARDDARHWMLLTEAEDAGLADVARMGELGEPLRRYARLQIACIPRVGELRALGVPARPVRELPRKLDALIKDAPAWSERPVPDAYGRPVGPITEEDIDQLRAFAPSLASRARDLDRATSIPQTLDHSNLWPEYITMRGDTYVVSDWSDAAVTCPFFGVAAFLLSTSYILGDPTIITPLRESYLQPWTRFAPRKELDRLFDLVLQLVPVQYAAMYHHELLPKMGATWEKEGTMRIALGALITLEHKRRSTSSRQSAPPKQRAPSAAPPSQVPAQGPQRAGDPDLDKLLQIFGTS